MLLDDGTQAVFDTPTLTIAGQKGNKRQYQASEMARLLEPVKLAIVESVHSMPGQGVRSMFSMGYGLGLWIGLLVGLKISYELVTPQRWKAAMMDGMGKDKDASRFRAMAVFPRLASGLTRKKDQGRADALLIAEYGRRRLGDRS